MKRVTIYVDEVEWEGVKESAYQARKSAGAYLMGLHRPEADITIPDTGDIRLPGTTEAIVVEKKPKYTSKY